MTKKLLLQLLHHMEHIASKHELYLISIQNVQLLKDTSLHAHLVHDQVGKNSLIFTQVPIKNIK